MRSKAPPMLSAMRFPVALEVSNAPMTLRRKPLNAPKPFVS